MTIVGGRAVKPSGPVLATGLGLPAAGLTVAALAFARANGPSSLREVGVVVALLVIPFTVVGVIVTWHRSENPIGPLLCAVGSLQAINVSANQYGLYGLTGPRPLPAAAEATWLADITWFPSLALLVTFLPLLFPTGRPPTPRWRWLGWCAGGGLAVTVLTWGVVSWSARGLPLLGEQTSQPLTGVGLLLPVGITAVAGSAVGCLASLGLRLRRARGDERQQLLWLLAALGASLLTIATSFAVNVPGRSTVVRDLLLGLAALAVPVAIGVAILRYRLYDIGFLVNRTLVYGGLSAAVLSIYVTVVVLTGSLVQGWDDWQAALPATAVVALVLLPLRARLQGWVNRLMYGDRDDPYAVLARLGQHLAAVRTPEDTMTGLVATVASALRLGYVAVHLDGAASTPPVAAQGARPERPAVFPLTYHGECVGSLAVGGPTPGVPLPARDRRLLEALAAQAGVAVHAERLTLDLQRSREQLVSAREEERRRLRRDLHDGLGPTLAGVALGVAAAGNLVRTDPEAATAVLAPVHDQVKSAIGDIRRLVEGLRPPALDELGLVDALRGNAMRFEVLATRNGADLRFSVEAPEPLPPLTAAVETAAYLIALEAMTNVIRHSGARHCRLRISYDEALRLEVTDDGVGIRGRPAGVGTASMRERAAELGGTIAVRAAAPDGTSVTATLPVPA
ncbi:hypothetical protein BH20ACT5_BH20ACT5_10880 [soil metagenome]